MNILLINPPAEVLKQEGSLIFPPLGLLYIGAVLEKAKHKVRIVDCVARNWNKPKKNKKGGETFYRFDVEEDYLRNFILDFQPEFVGIANLFATSEDTCIKLAGEIKKYNKAIKIVVGGTNASARAHFFLEHDCIDFVILGEGEYTFRDLVSYLKDNADYTTLPGLCFKKDNKISISPTFNWIKNLDELPFPAYHLLENSIENYFHGKFGNFFVENRILTTTTSRGCVRNCVFCSGMKYLGRWRERSPENVIEELLYLKNNFGVKEIAFVDANINLKKDRFVGIMNLMKEGNLNLKWSPFGGIFVQTFTPDLVKLMRQTGCHSMNLAVEHGDTNMQKYIGKIVPLEKVQLIIKECKKYGIWSHCYFVVGLPGETEDSLNKCLDYAKKANFDSLSFMVGTPLPGSRLYDDLSERKLLKSGDLRFTAKKNSWTDLEPAYLTAKIKKFMINYAVYKIINEFRPDNLFWRIRTFNSSNIKIYRWVLIRFFKNLIFR